MLEPLKWMNPIMVADAKGIEGKVPVFGILQQGGKVSTQVISAATSQICLSIIWEKVVTDSIVYTDSYRSDNALDISELKHSRMNHSKLFADKHHHIIWHQELLESGKTPLASIQWNSQTTVPPVLERR